MAFIFKKLFMQKEPVEEYEVFYMTQDIVLFNNKNEVLALKHFTGKWLLPGGHINKGEYWLDALKREITEETGIVDFEIGDVFSVDSWINFQGPHYGAFFLGDTEEEKIVLSKEHTEYKWLGSLEEIKNLDWWCDPLRERVIEAFERKKL